MSVIDEALLDQAITAYMHCATIKHVARALNISTTKATKLLVTAGAIAPGVPSGATGNYANRFVPYDKCVYNSGNPSINAQNIRRHRVRKGTTKPPCP